MLRFTNDFESSRKALAAVKAAWVSGWLASKSPAASKWPMPSMPSFNRSDAVDAPLIVGDRLGELALDRRLRVEAGNDFLGEFPVGVHSSEGRTTTRAVRPSRRAFMLERALPSGVRPEVFLGGSGSGGLGDESSRADS
jgi:hypothetical protein